MPEVKQVVDIDESAAARYPGKYNVMGTIITVRMGNNGLELKAFGEQYWNMYFTSETEFFVREYKANMKFNTDKDNKVTGFSFNGMTAKKTE